MRREGALVSEVLFVCTHNAGRSRIAPPHHRAASVIRIDRRVTQLTPAPSDR